ncbi:MAG: iron ABC transporter permease [Thermoanaerobaculia bacterium]|nr:iron ABC transporter permease [Thermoanaerobaculia bacterium]
MRRARPPLTARRAGAWLAALGLLLALAVAAGATLGASGLGWGALASGDAAARVVLLEVRLPRVLLAALLGGGLAVAGAALQGLFRNPLADPYLLGIAGGASLGGVAAVAVAGAAGARVVPLAAFAGALAALLLVERLATHRGRLDLYALLLTGAVLNAFSAALIFFLQSVASAEQLHAIVFYLMGRLASPAPRALALAAGATLVATLALAARARDYNALALGEEAAAQLGVDLERLKRATFGWASLLTAVAVAAAGPIGFVGLLLPHLLRLAAGPDHRLLLPAAFLGGGAFLVLADLAARTLLVPNELPVGVLTALLGGPFFLWLLRRRAREAPLG